MKRVLITVPSYDKYCPDARKLLDAQGYEVILPQKTLPFYSYDELAPIIGDIDAVIMGLDDWSEEVFKIAPRLKAVAKFGVGVDNVDIPNATRRGIKVINARGSNSQSVAEIALCLMLAASRNIVFQSMRLREGEWVRFMGTEVTGKTIGLVGFGDIARRLTKLLGGFDVRTLACDPLADEAAAEQYGVTLTSPEEVLSRSDIVSLHIPAVAENRHFMNEKRFALMKEGAILINTARGAVLDEQALLSAIRGGKLRAVALDVYEHEPLEASSPLLREERIICLPHTAAETAESYRNVGLSVTKDIIEVLEGRTPKNWVNRPA